MTKGSWGFPPLSAWHLDCRYTTRALCVTPGIRRNKFWANLRSSWTESDRIATNRQKPLIPKQTMNARRQKSILKQIYGICRLRLHSGIPWAAMEPYRTNRTAQPSKRAFGNHRHKITTTRVNGVYRHSFARQMQNVLRNYTAYPKPVQRGRTTMGTGFYSHAGRDFTQIFSSSRLLW